MNEKEFLEQIRKSAENITPPESLHPDHIEKCLKQSPAGRTSQKRTWIYRLGGLAAIFTVAVMGFRSAQNFRLTQTEQEIAFHPETASQAKAMQEEAVSQETVTQERADSQETSTQEETVSQEEKLATAESYEAIYSQLYQQFGNTSYYGYDMVYASGMGGIEMGKMEIVMEETMDMAVSQSTSSATASSDTHSSAISYSQTNVQEAGVDEADIVKTDGNYIYILKRSGSLVILSAKEGIMELISSVDFPAEESLHELYVDGDLLSLITSEYTTEMDTSRENVIASRSVEQTKLYTYDISDRTSPELVGTVTQDGTYSQSRKNGNYIYLFTQFSPDIRDTYEDSSIVPGTSSGKIAASSVYLPETMNYSTYLVASSVDIHNPDQTINQKAVLSVASSFYVSMENIYIANENWADGTPRTELLKLNYAEGIITGTAAGSVEGYLNNSFSLNEHNGYLRVVSTTYDEEYNERNGLYIFDENLELTGCIRNLAPDETIRSARFFGDIGYFVTFRQTDPLFSVDLSDPAHPQVLGELKITGFSSYLHFYSEKLLLGLGYEADPETGIQTGLKLSMFDISDPSNVTEVRKLVLDGITWCASLENYKSILLDPEKNIFGFVCDNRYLVFSYDEEKGFVSEFIYDFYQDLVNGYSGSSEYDTRGIYINDVFYLIQPEVAASFQMENDFAPIGQLSLN